MKLLVLILFYFLIGCNAGRVESKNQGKDIPDSLFIDNGLKNTKDFKGGNQDKYHLDKSTAIKLYFPYIKKQFGYSDSDLPNLNIPDIQYVSKMDIIGNIVPIIINASGDDLDELVLITLDKDLNYIDGFYLSGNCGCVGLDERNLPYVRACPERESSIGKTSITTYHKKITYKVGSNANFESVIIDSLTYKTTISELGFFSTRMIDSTRVIRKVK